MPEPIIDSSPPPPTLVSSSSQLSLQSQLECWSAELKSIEREAASLDDALDERRKRRSGNGITGSGGSSGISTSERRSPREQHLRNASDDVEYDQYDDSNAAPPSTAAPPATAQASTHAPPPTAQQLNTAGGGQTRGYTPQFADSIQSDDTDGAYDQSNASSKQWKERENLLQLDEGDEEAADDTSSTSQLRAATRVRPQSRRRRTAEHNPSGLHENTKFHLPLDGIEAVLASANPVPTSSSSQSQPVAAAVPASRSSLPHMRPPTGSHPSVGLGSMLMRLNSGPMNDPTQAGMGMVDQRRRNSGSTLLTGGMLPSLNPNITRTMPDMSSKHVTSNSNLHSRPVSGESASGLMAASRGSGPNSGTTTPQLRERARRLPTNSQLPALAGAGEVGEASTMQATPAQTNERRTLTALAEARAERRRSQPLGGSIDQIPADAKINAMLPSTLSNSNSRSALLLSSNRRRTADSSSDGSITFLTPVTSTSNSIPPLSSSASTSKATAQHHRPTTPYSNAASFEAIAKRRSLPPLGLANIGEQLHAH